MRLETDKPSDHSAMAFCLLGKVTAVYFEDEGMIFSYSDGHRVQLTALGFVGVDLAIGVEVLPPFTQNCDPGDESQEPSSASR